MKIRMIEALEKEYWRGFKRGCETTRGVAEWIPSRDEFYCSNCGVVHKKTSTFCPDCGRMMMREKNDRI